MTAELRRGIVLAVVGLVGGFALVIALFGVGGGLKGVTDLFAPSATAPGEPVKPLAVLPSAEELGGRAEPRKAAGPESQSDPSLSSDPARTAPAGEASAAEKSAAERSAAEKSAALPKPADTRPGGGVPDQGRAPVAAVGEPTGGPSLDIVRVEPNGDTVIAGRAAPNAAIEMLRDNAPVARTMADASGQFVLVPPPLPAGSSEITLRTVGADGAVVAGAESVAVVVSTSRSTKPLIAVSSPDKPTRVVSQPDPVPGSVADVAGRAGVREDGTQGGTPGVSRSARLGEVPARPPVQPDATEPAKTATALRIVSVDAQEGGRLHVSGQGPSGATLRLYLNDTMVASGRAGEDGRIAFTIGRGVRSGQYQIRVDAVDPGSGKVDSRAEVAFAFPEAMARTAQAVPEVARTRTAPKAEALARTEPKAEALARTEPKAEAPARTAVASPPADGVATRLPADNRDRSRNVGALPAEVSSKPSPAAPEAAPVPRIALDRERVLTLNAPAPDAAPQPAPAQREASDETARRAAAPVAEAPDRPVSPQRPSLEPILPSAQQSAAPGRPPTAEVFVPEISTARIARGDSLWQISRRTYGKGNRYTVIFDANNDQIRNPNLIYPGQIFVLPEDRPSARAGTGRG